MSEEEKKTIEDCKELVQELKQHKDKDFIGRLYYKSKPVEDILSVLLNVIEGLQTKVDTGIEIKKEIEEAVNRLKRGIEDTLFSTLYSQEEEERDIKIVLEHLKNVKADLYATNNIISDYIDTTTKQEKMIELMLEEMTDCEFEMNCSNCNCECERDYDQLYSCNREYFENKAEESE